GNLRLTCQAVETPVRPPPMIARSACIGPGSGIAGTSDGRSSFQTERVSSLPIGRIGPALLYRPVEPLTRFPEIAPRLILVSERPRSRAAFPQTPPRPGKRGFH